MATSVSRPLSAYRNLLRTVKSVFKEDDFMLASAFREVRSKFEESKKENNVDKQNVLLDEAKEAEEFIKTYVVQAKLNERGNFEMKVEPHHASTTAEEAAIRPPKP